MNAYLRTGPQALSPEPSATGELILAPGAAAVPATGLLNVAGPGGAGVYGMMNAYLRTGTHHLSPEPGMEAEARQGSLQGTAAPPMHPYSPVSPLAATPGAGGTAARSASRRPISPSSVCSNGGVGSSGPAGSISLGAAPLPSPASSGRPASVPRLNLAALQQDQPKRDGTDGTEVSFGAVVPLAAAAQQQQPDSPGGGELPTARFSPDASPAAGAGGEPAADPTPQRHVHRVPSPITFCLPDDSPKQQEAQPPGEGGRPAETRVPTGAGACVRGLTRAAFPTTAPPQPPPRPQRFRLASARGPQAPTSQPGQRQARQSRRRKTSSFQRRQQRRRPTTACRASAQGRACCSPTRSLRCCCTCGVRSMLPPHALRCGARS